MKKCPFELKLRMKQPTLIVSFENLLSAHQNLYRPAKLRGFAILPDCQNRANHTNEEQQMTILTITIINNGKLTAFTVEI